MIRNRFYQQSDKTNSSEIKLQRSRLYSFDKIPEYLQYNPFIRTGYRHGLSFKDCLIR
jgi:hypothetical protein